MRVLVLLLSACCVVFFRFPCPCESAHVPYHGVYRRGRSSPDESCPSPAGAATAVVIVPVAVGRRLRPVCAPSTQCRYYNHSTLVDLILGHLLGIRLLLQTNHTLLVVDPLATAASTRWFAADHVRVGDGHNVTVAWDADGTRFPALHALGAKSGFSVVVDGVLAFNGPTIQRVELPLLAGGRVSSASSPSHSLPVLWQGTQDGGQQLQVL